MIHPCLTNITITHQAITAKETTNEQPSRRLGPDARERA
jgi:hypothetical protein